MPASHGPDFESGPKPAHSPDTESGDADERSRETRPGTNSADGPRGHEADAGVSPTDARTDAKETDEEEIKVTEKMIRKAMEVAETYGVIDEGEVGNPLIWREILQKALN